MQDPTKISEDTQPENPIASESRKFELLLPKPGDLKQTTGIPNTGSVVIIGANGSGKSRLGSWLDQTSPHHRQVHRISAQKSLSIPDSVSPIALSKAQSTVWYGHEKASENSEPWQFKIGTRWEGHPTSFLLNDFQALLVLLFSDEFEESIKYRQAAKHPEGRTEPPETKIDIVKRIWEQTLPHRKLLIGSGEITTYPSGNPLSSYRASEMSDGERVVFYLIGQVVSAAADAVIVIDEPEIHLHQSIQSTLWDGIEDQRPDCQFVYLTHDLHFAASRAGAPKVCVRSFDGTNWDWFIAPETGIPEEVLLLIIGSRKPILFVEGEQTSLDQHVFSQIYPDYTVIGCGGCQQVINAAISFSALKSLHFLKCYGIVDRDSRSDLEVDSLKARGIYVLDVAEIENLFLAQAIVEQIAQDLLQAKEFPRIVADIKEFVFTSLRNERETVISRIASAEIESMFRAFDSKAQGCASIETAFIAMVRQINIPAIYAKIETKITSILSQNNYGEAIKLYSNKGLVAHLASLFAMKRDPFLDYVHRLLRSKRGSSIIAKMQALLPILPPGTTPPLERKIASKVASKSELTEPAKVVEE